tara:strand:- start:428 stop:1015 length:588 start_codon:yes stop_codon:yes gene_type:complete
MLLNSLSDQKLVSIYLSGDNLAFDHLLERHKNRIYAFIMSKIKDRDIADDIFQDTFIKAINSLKKGKYQEEGKFLPWVMRICHNLIIDHFRKNQKLKSIRPTNDFDIFDFISDPSKSQEDLIIEKQIFHDLRLIIEKLPEDQKKVLKFRYLEDLSFKEIAKLTNTSINTSLGRMRYALINLRKLAQKNQIDLQLR